MAHGNREWYKCIYGIGNGVWNIRNYWRRHFELTLVSNPLSCFVLIINKFKVTSGIVYGNRDAWKLGIV